jgi:hypothetical protein
MRPSAPFSSSCREQEPVPSHDYPRLRSTHLGPPYGSIFGRLRTKTFSFDWLCAHRRLGTVSGYRRMLRLSKTSPRSSLSQSVIMLRNSRFVLPDFLAVTYTYPHPDLFRLSCNLLDHRCLSHRIRIRRRGPYTAAPCHFRLVRSGNHQLGRHHVLFRRSYSDQRQWRFQRMEGEDGILVSDYREHPACSWGLYASRD